MRSYLEVPLRVHGGAVIGSYCVVHTEPRDFSQRDIETLTEIGTCIVDHLKLLRIKQEHDRAQQLIQGLGTIVAGSLDLPFSITAPEPLGQHHPARTRLPDAAVLDNLATATPNEAETEAGIDDSKEPRTSAVDNLDHNLKNLRVNGSSPADLSQQLDVPHVPSNAASRSRPDTEVLPEHERERRRDRRDGDDDESMFAKITKFIYLHTDVDGVLILDGQIADSFADPAYSHPPPRRQSTPMASSVSDQEGHTGLPMLCKEVGVCLKPNKRAAMSSQRQSKQLFSSVLHALLCQYPAGTVLRREKDAPILEQYMQSREQGEKMTNIPIGALDDKELLFEYLEGPLQIILAPMWAASHRKGPLCTISWTRDRIRYFEQEDVALLSAFCNSAVANLARKDAISTMQTKSKFMESISHELRSPVHGILASAELLEAQYTDA